MTPVLDEYRYIARRGFFGRCGLCGLVVEAPRLSGGLSLLRAHRYASHGGDL